MVHYHRHLVDKVESRADGEMRSRKVNQGAAATIASREYEDQAGLQRWEGEEWSCVSRMPTAAQFCIVNSRASLCLPMLFSSHSFIYLLESVWPQINKRFELVFHKRQSRK